MREEVIQRQPRKRRVVQIRYHRLGAVRVSDNLFIMVKPPGPFSHSALVGEDFTYDGEAFQVKAALDYAGGRFLRVHTG